MTSVTIGSSVTSIGSGAFYGCTGLTSIYSLNTTPPTCDSYTFYGIDYNTATLYVPKDASEAYSTADVWKMFQNIKEMDETGISTITAEGGTAGAARYYDMNGRRLSAPVKGLNIVNGKKVIVK